MSLPPDREVPRGHDELVSFLPPRVWYLTSTGDDMWCRRPYGFWFSSDEAATRFATAMGLGELTPIGIDARELIREETLAGLREMDVTRIFLDPEIDASSGDVHGRILRLESLN